MTSSSARCPCTSGSRQATSPSSVEKSSCFLGQSTSELQYPFRRDFTSKASAADELRVTVASLEDGLRHAADRNASLEKSSQDQEENSRTSIAQVATAAVLPWCMADFQHRCPTHHPCSRSKRRAILVRLNSLEAVNTDSTIVLRVMLRSLERARFSLTEPVCIERGARSQGDSYDSAHPATYTRMQMLMFFAVGAASEAA